MKYSVAILGIFIFGILFLNYRMAHALGVTMPVGGKVASIVPGVLCSSEYGVAFAIKPANAAPPLSYIIPYGTKAYSYYVFRPGVWFLGLYSSVLDLVSCKTTSIPSVPYPVFRILFYGASN